jgi:ABC-type multidrug transport system fused ATPase/permease subunit
MIISSSAGPTIMVVVSFAHYSLVLKKPLTAEIAFVSFSASHCRWIAANNCRHPLQYLSVSQPMIIQVVLSDRVTELKPVLLDLPRSIAELLQEILSANRISNFIQTRDVDYLEASQLSLPKGNSTSEPLYITGTITWNIAPPPIAKDTIAEPSAAETPVFRLQDINVQFPRGATTLVAGKFGSGKTLLLLAMLGEARLVEGKISYTLSDLIEPYGSDDGNWNLLPNGVAYVPQASHSLFCINACHYPTYPS